MYLLYASKEVLILRINFVIVIVIVTIDLDIRLLPFDTFKKSVKTHLYLKYFVN